MRSAALLFLCAAALASCAPAPQREGAPPASGAPRIVSLNPCSDAILAEVADADQIAAISHYSHDPGSSSMGVEAARRFPAVGDSVEEVLNLRPDVVVAGTFMPPATVAALRRLGYRLELLPIAGTVEESRAQVRRLAALAGHPERGEALIARIDAALQRAAPGAGEPVPTVVWQSGGIVPGEGALITDLLRRTGHASFSAARGLGQAEALPLERMLADPPQLILSAGDTAGEDDRLLYHPALDHLAQTRRERLDPSLLWCGGPTIIRAAERLAQLRRSMELRLAAVDTGAAQ